jgi:hypothetical protein
VEVVLVQLEVGVQAVKVNNPGQAATDWLIRLTEHLHIIQAAVVVLKAAVHGMEMVVPAVAADQTDKPEETILAGAEMLTTAVQVLL